MLFFKPWTKIKFSRKKYRKTNHTPWESMKRQQYLRSQEHIGRELTLRQLGREKVNGCVGWYWLIHCVMTISGRKIICATWDGMCVYVIRGKQIMMNFLRTSLGRCRALRFCVVFLIPKSPRMLVFHVWVCCGAKKSEKHGLRNADSPPTIGSFSHIHLLIYRVILCLSIANELKACALLTDHVISLLAAVFDLYIIRPRVIPIYSEQN